MKTKNRKRWGQKTKKFKAETFYKEMVEAEYNPEGTPAKRAITEIHKFHPKYIFLAETHAIGAGYILKEALRKAYPNEPLPKFYRFDPQQVLKFMRASGGLPQKHGDGKDNIYYESKKEELQDFLKKRIKDKDAPILVYDSDWNMGESPGSIVALLRNPKEYGLDPNLRCNNIKMNSYLGEEREKSNDSNPHRQKTLQNLGLSLSSDMLPKTNLGFGISGRLTTKKDKRGGYNFRGRIGQSKKAMVGVSGKPLEIYEHNLERLRKYKQLGSKLGEQILQEQQKHKSLENKVISSIAIAGFVSSLAFLSFNITGNTIADLSIKASSSIGIGLFVIALIFGLFWLKNKRRK